MNTIIPSSDLRNKYQEISKLCRETQKPVFITVNGRGDTVILNIEAFEKIELCMELMRQLDASEKDIKAGRVGSADEMIERLRKKYNV